MVDHLQAASLPSSQREAEPAPTAARRLEAWLRGRRRAVLLVLVAFASVVRVGVFLELSSGPCLHWHDWNETDMSHYLRWARAIAAGDWLSRSLRIPQHDWHIEAAQVYAETAPEKWQALCAEMPDASDAERRQALWERWAGGGRFYQDPFYSYFIGGVFALVGDHPNVIFGVQAVIGVMTVALICIVGRRLFDDLAGVSGAALAALYPTFVFYDFVLLRATWIVFAGLLIVLLIDRATERPTGWRWLLAGLSIGVSVLLKVHFIALFPFALVALFWQPGRSWRRGAVGAACLTLGLLLGLAPLAGRNLAVGLPPFASGTGGLYGFVCSNGVDATEVVWDTHSPGVVLVQTEGAALPTAIAILQTHPTIGSFLALLARRVFVSFWWFEQGNNINLYFGERYSLVLRCLPVSFGLIAPLALVGAVLSLRRARRCVPLYGLVFVSLFVLLSLVIFARYRLPLVGAVLPLAGWTFSRLVNWVAEKRWWRAGLAMLVLVGLGIVSFSPERPGDVRVTRTDVRVAEMVYYAPRLAAALDSGNWLAAEELLQQILLAQPDAIRDLGPQRPAISADESILAFYYASVYESYAALLENAGYPAEARGPRARANELVKAAGVLVEPSSQPASGDAS